MTAAVSEGFVVKFDLNDVSSGGADDMARALLNAWQTNGGRLCDQIAGFTDHLVILDGRPCASDSPPVLFHGENSLLNKSFSGIAETDSPQIKRSDFSADYRKMVARTYHHVALEKQPVFDLVRVSHPMKSGRFYKTTYHRLLLPVTTDQGASFTLCYSLDLETLRYPEAPSRQQRRPEADITSGINLNMPFVPAGRPR